LTKETILIGPRRFVEVIYNGTGAATILVKEGLPPLAKTLVFVDMPPTVGMSESPPPTVRIAKNVAVKTL